MEYLLFQLYPKDYASFTQGLLLTLTVYGVSIVVQFMKQCLNKKHQKRSLQSNMLHINSSHDKQEALHSN
jgi:hypothetical protein